MASGSDDSVERAALSGKPVDVPGNRRVLDERRSVARLDAGIDHDGPSIDNDGCDSF